MDARLSINVQKKWNAIRWNSITIWPGVKFSGAVSQPGLYRVRLKKSSNLVISPWQVKACKKLKSEIPVGMTGLPIYFTGLSAQNWLSIGKTTDINKRLCQHLGTNPNNNRLFRCFKQLLEPKKDDFVREFIREHVVIEYVVETDWIKRDLLESYGKAILKPLFDIKAEH